MSKGDRVRVLVDAGGDEAREFEMVADKNGRRIEVHQGRGDERTFVLVEKVAHTGTVLLTWRFMASRVVALVEERETEEPEEIPDPVPGQVQMGLLTNAEAITFTTGEAQDIVLVPAKPVTWGSGALIAKADGQDVAAAAGLYIDAREESDTGTDDDDRVVLPDAQHWAATEDDF